MSNGTVSLTFIGGKVLL